MPVLLAYVAVVIVWSTTPLGVKWSGDGLSPVMGAFARIALASVAARVIAKAMRIEVPWHKAALKAYLYANIGWSVGLIAVYLAAKTLSSGLISVMFGLSPIVSALVALFCFCLSSVLIKRLDAGLHPLSQTAGSLTCALPLYAVAALTPLITPVFALLLGSWLNHEVITDSVLAGAACILAGLLLFQWPYKSLRVVKPAA